MRRILSWFFGTVVRIVLVGLVLSVLVSAAVSMGVIDVGPADDGTIDTPEPLPDWPFVWEIPTDGDPGVEPEPQPDPTDEADSGDSGRKAPGTTSLATGQETISSAAIEARVHERINAIRAENDLSTLDHDGAIATIARTHSYDMAEREYFSHVSPDGKRPADRFGDLYPNECRAVGENLALVGIPGATDADEIAERIVTGWMTSEGHRENILTGRWDSHGIGVYIDEGRIYTTQNFCDEW
jgi:uncharacterized protein YkwD